MVDPPARHPMASLLPRRPKQRIADRDLATCHHFGVDPHIDVAERATEGGDDIEVSLRGDWIDLGCRSSSDRRDYPQPRGSDRDFGIDPIMFAPGRCPIEVDIRAKSD